MAAELKVLNESELKALYAYLFSDELPVELGALADAQKALSLVGEPLSKEGMIKRWAEMTPKGRYGYYDFVMRPAHEASTDPEEYRKFLPEKLATYRAHFSQLAAAIGWDA